MSRMIRFMGLLGCLLSLGSLDISAQDTFSIVAVDTATGEVGGAGASCLDATAIATGAAVISQLVPGRGAIHTQSFYLSANQLNARNRMLAGDSPQEIIAWLIANDAQGNPTQRQYGIADFDSSGQPRAAAFTGVNCLDYKGQIEGVHYAIQGNILLGPQVLDSMEARFLAATGSLAERLMAALQGANIPGADSRCLSEGVSSQSAFIRVARPNNPYGNNHLDLVVAQTPFGVEPIDSLQVLFDGWSPPSGAFALSPATIAIGMDSLVQGDSQVYWICAGDSLTASGNQNVYLLEDSARLRLSSGSGNRVYLKAGARVNAQGALQTQIYYQPGSIIAVPGIAPRYFSTDSVVFDLTDAPLPGCAGGATALAHPAGWQANWQAHTRQLSLQDSGHTLRQVELIDLKGQTVWQQDLKPGTTRQFQLPDFPAGIYLLRLSGSPGQFTQRIFLP